MKTIQAALYARVSSEQQAAAHTIESQLAALTERARSDGTPVPVERQFVDEGFSGATLVRPALDRLRDLTATGVINRIYVHSPDRLARNYAYQVLLIDEWRRTGVEVVFLNRPLGQSQQKTTCYCKCKGSWPSTNEQKSWSAAAEVRSTRPRVVL